MTTSVTLPSDRQPEKLSDEELLEAGREVLRHEAEELVRAAARFGMELVQAARIVEACKGRIVVSGIGKAGHVGRKVAATLSSLGTPSFFLQASEAAHGDLGMVRHEDVALLISHSGRRAGKDAHNREKGIRRLEKAYKAGHLSKDNINRRGYNKFLYMEGDTTVSINYDRIQEDARWDGLKGYLTNTDIPTADVVSAYHNLWNVEKAFRIAKSKIEIRPMFHFTRRRIEAHICICFVALKVYKELERLLKLSDIKMSVDKVLNMAKTVTTISVYMPQNKEHLTKTMPRKRHKPIAKLFDEEFWEAQ